MKNFSVPAFFIIFSSFSALSLTAQTELDAHASAASYGETYVPVPENQKTTTPALLEGIWQGTDRYVFFIAPPEQRAAEAVLSGDDTIVHPLEPSAQSRMAAEIQPSDIAVILKTYYGWFYDRAAEPASYKKDTERSVCTATAPDAEKITITYEPLQDRKEQGSSGVWELVIRYGAKKRDVTRIPVAVIGNGLYLDFIIRGKTGDTRTSSDGNKLYGFWQGVSGQQGIRISPMPMKENLYSYYIVDDAVYRLRYWLTTMEYTDAFAVFTDGDASFHAQKHIVSDANIFTCVTGRSLQIRNVEKISSQFKDYTLDDTGTICAFGKPYLTKMTGKGSETQLMEIVAEANRRRKPDPPPLFPQENLDWHWDLITLLEKDNTQVQGVRQRQREFAEQHGKEGRDAAVQAASYSSRTKLETEVTGR